jgi:hypothetical protein
MPETTAALAYPYFSPAQLHGLIPRQHGGRGVDARRRQLPGDGARLVRGPAGRRVGGAAGHDHAARVHRQEEKDVQRLQPPGLHGEDVARQQPRRVRAQNGRPGEP